MEDRMDEQPDAGGRPPGPVRPRGAGGPRAAGFVLVREGPGALEYLLLVSRKSGEGFPKGHEAPGESELETARREVEEETGLGGLVPLPGFRTAIRYPVTKKGSIREKTVVYFLAKVAADVEVRLSEEHVSSGWWPLAEARERVVFPTARLVLREAALYLKDGGLFDLEPATETEADAYFGALPHADGTLLAHVRGAARLARQFADALLGCGVQVHVEAAATGGLLHDTGRALGRHDDHQLAGLHHLRQTALAPYAFACLSHFTKGASVQELEAAGLSEQTARAFEEAVDMTRFTWEEKCVALGDSCMRQDESVEPRLRFEDLRLRYGDVPLIDLQARRAEAIRRELGEILGEDPIERVGLAP